VNVRVVILAVVALGAAASLASAPSRNAAAATSAGGALLPDLDIVTPQGPIVKTVTQGGKTHFKLGFISAAVNIGSGPLTVVGHRSKDTAPMVASQIVTLREGGTKVYPNIGRLHYVSYPSHSHFHYLGFMVYELRRMSDYHLVRPDEKAGFCLGDDYAAPGRASLHGSPKKAVYTHHCGPHAPKALDVSEGISVGYGDIYTQIREGQDVDLTGLPAGRYYLVHRVNANHALRESDYRNNASSVLLELTWPHGMKKAPAVHVAAACTAVDHCRLGFFYDKIP
jgi:hypothetical protein